MQLDQSRIAIHERSWLDNLDLALQVIRAHGPAVLLAGLVGMLPMALANVWLLSALYGGGLSEDVGVNSFFMSVLLVMLELPLATAPLTLYLGQALFVDKPRPKQIARDFWRCLPQLLLFQVIVRAPLILLLLTWIIPYTLWPYLNEVILLERNPLNSRQGQLSTRRRSSLLHSNYSGDYLLQAAGSAALALILILALSVTLTTLLDALFGIQVGKIFSIVAMQGILWTVALYFTVVRFLCYLDQRIRNEGWEVELFLRAERERLTRQIA